MKYKTLLLSVFALLGLVTNAQECPLPLSVNTSDLNTELSENAQNVLANSLSRIATKSGFSSDLNMNQFILTAKIDQLDKSVLPGPPTQVVNDWGVTIHIVDNYSKTKFATEYIEVKGVGTNETKSETNAARNINASNVKIARLINTGKQKILDYYNANYNNILGEAKKKASLKMYEEALTLAMSIPECSEGGRAAQKVCLQIYEKYRDQICLSLLNRARMAWATSQDASGAAEAAEYITNIDPDASCYKEAMALYKEIKGQLRADIDFETREKYRDSVKLEKQKIDAMRQVGVAYGRGQKAKTTNLMWVR